MSEILSQNEIDALLVALSSGEIGTDEHVAEENHKVKKYDFKRPNKFSKEHIKTLEMIHENFARVASNYLTGHLRTSTLIKVISSEQTTFEEFIHSIPNPTILITMYMEPFEGVFMFETGPQYVFQIIDILFGGQGKSLIKTREFTEIEKNIIKRINLKLLENLKYAWEDIMDIDVKLDSLETNPVLNQVMAPNEPVALITLSVDINNSQSLMNMCLPYVSLEKYIDKLVIQYKTITTNREENEHKAKIEHNLSGVEVNSFVELGKSTITVEDFLNLSIGDCIRLDKKTAAPLDMYVENDVHFRVYPGLIGKKIGVQISEIIDKDVEDYE